MSMRWEDEVWKGGVTMIEHAAGKNQSVNLGKTFSTSMFVVSRVSPYSIVRNTTYCAVYHTVG